jgi:hypothetical protein
MRRLYSGLDRAQWLANFLQWFRTRLPARRGSLVLAAIGLTVLSLVVHILWVLTSNLILGLCGFTLLHIAIILGFFGILLAEALGRGFRE